jgi:hypothetical protein
MKFLFLSGQGAGLGLAVRLRLEGNDVAAWIRESRYKTNFDGLLHKVRWEDFLDEDTIVVFDSLGGGKTADRLRARGHRVLGGSVFADQVGRDPETSTWLVEEARVELPKDHNYEGWFDGKKFRPQWFVSQAWHALMPGELGPRGVHSTFIVVQALSGSQPYGDLELALEDQYEGPVSIGPQGVYLGMLFDQVPTMLELLQGSIASWMDGTNETPAEGMAMGLRLSIPPYPSVKWTAPSGVLIEGLTKEDRPHLYFHDVTFAKNQLTSSGANGAIVTVTGHVTPELWDVVQRIRIPDLQYRNDWEELLGQSLVEFRQASPSVPDTPGPGDTVALPWPTGTEGV